MHLCFSRVFILKEKCTDEAEFYIWKYVLQPTDFYSSYFEYKEISNF